ncbi:hypothetical protein IWZ01DRAFT_239771 [Phyllosticta capitalensis]
MSPIRRRAANSSSKQAAMRHAPSPKHPKGRPLSFHCIRHHHHHHHHQQPPLCAMDWPLAVTWVLLLPHRQQSHKASLPPPPYAHNQSIPLDHTNPRRPPLYPSVGHVRLQLFPMCLQSLFRAALVAAASRLTARVRRAGWLACLAFCLQPACFLVAAGSCVALCHLLVCPARLALHLAILRLSGRVCVCVCVCMCVCQTPTRQHSLDDLDPSLHAHVFSAAAAQTGGDGGGGGGDHALFLLILVPRFRVLLFCRVPRWCMQSIRLLACLSTITDDGACETATVTAARPYMTLNAVGLPSAGWWVTSRRAGWPCKSLHRYCCFSRCACFGGGESAARSRRASCRRV